MGADARVAMLSYTSSLLATYRMCIPLLLQLSVSGAAIVSVGAGVGRLPRSASVLQLAGDRVHRGGSLAEEHWA